MEGILQSEDDHTYPIVNGIPRLVVDFQNEQEKRTVNAFGKEWGIFNHSEGYLGSQDLFFDFVRGLKPADFNDKTVLDAGCGNGRWAKIMSLLGCKNIIAMDYSSSVDQCFRNTRDCDNVVVVQGSIYNPPFPRGKFDLIFSIGVIDHLPDPKKGIELLRDFIHKEGRISFWVYALEGNELFLKFAEPLRKITTRLPQPPLVMISRLISFPIWLYVHTVNKNFGLKKNGDSRLPMAHYLSFLEKVEYEDIVNIVYDQLTPVLTHYISRRQLNDWARELNLEIQHLVFRNNNSYSVLARSGKNA